jgi:SNF2 family DNA or RNA helicase
LKSEDYLELPGITYNDIPVVLDQKALKAYREMEKKMLLEVDPETIVTAPGAAALSNKLQQLCNGAIYDENRGVHEIHNCKLEAFSELIESLNGKSALVFYGFRHDVPRLKAALAGTGLRVRELKTTEDEDEWNAGRVDVLLTHPVSSAYGLNLQDGGNHVIWFGLNWNLELYLQANDRLNRQGQMQKVIVHHLVVEDGRDEDILEALQSKGDTQERLMQSLKARIDNYKREEKLA